MAWLTALFKALLEWLSSEAKKDTKASDADATPKDLKDKWRKRIQQQEQRMKKQSENYPIGPKGDIS
jgi:fructoselysine-6-P-deglycase FrlB-like protein|tara:strand:- start:295 stop:495 length:201 start_codon:yes stop_codon:yes gene_type:complete